MVDPTVVGDLEVPLMTEARTVVVDPTAEEVVDPEVPLTMVAPSIVGNHTMVATIIPGDKVDLEVHSTMADHPTEVEDPTTVEDHTMEVAVDQEVTSTRADPTIVENHTAEEVADLEVPLTMADQKTVDCPTIS